MEGEWLCYRGGQFKTGRIGDITEVVTNGGRMVMLYKSPVQWRVNGHVKEVVTNERRMVMSHKWQV